MKINQALFLLTFFQSLLFISANNNYNLSEKVMIWSNNIKIYKCPVYAIEENHKDMDPSILVFKSIEAAERLKEAPVILSDQTDYLAHHVEYHKIFDDFTFAYASMASLDMLFSSLHIVDQPGYFEKKKDPNKEYIPDDPLIEKLKRKTPSDNTYELRNHPVYKCKGKNGSIYLLVKSTNITSFLKTDDIVYSDKSDGFLETIVDVNQIDVGIIDYRLVVETILTDCSNDQDTLEEKIANLHLIKKERNDLNCFGGKNSNSSLYLTKKNTYISKLIKDNKLINNVIIGRDSNKFAYRIVSIKKIGNFFLYETSEKLNPVQRSKRGLRRKLKKLRDKFKKIISRVVSYAKKILKKLAKFSKTFNVSFRRRFYYGKTTYYDLAPLGSASTSILFNPAVTVSASIKASIFGAVLNMAGLTLDIDLVLNSKLNLNLNTIEKEWPEITIVPTIELARFIVFVGPIPIPGTVNFECYTNDRIKLIAKPSYFNAEANLGYNIRLPFIYNRYGSNVYPDQNSYTKTNAYFRVDTSLNFFDQPKIIYTRKVTPKVNAKWPDLGVSLPPLKPSFIPNFLKKFSNKILKFLNDEILKLKIIVTAGLPLFASMDSTLCSNECPIDKQIQIINNYGIGPFNLNLKAPFIERSLMIPSDGSPIKIFEAFKSCLRIPIYTCSQSTLTTTTLTTTTLNSTKPKNLTLINTLIGHNDYIFTLKFLPDGTLASGSGDNTIKIWNTDTGNIIRTLTGHNSWVYSLAVLPNGTLASGSYDNTIKIWNTSTGDNIKTLTGHNSYVRSLAVLPDGTLASGSGDSTIKIWNTDTGNIIRTLTGHSINVLSLAVLPDGTLASGSGDNTIKIWNTNTGNNIKTLTGHSSYVISLVILSDGTLASGSGDNTIKIWNINTGNNIRNLTEQSVYVLSLAVLPDGTLASGLGDSTIKIWNTDTGNIIRTLTGHSSNVLSLAVLPDGTLASGSSDRNIKIWSNKI